MSSNLRIDELEVHTQAAPETKLIKQLKIDPPVVIVCHSKLRRWATEHTLSILFLNVYFIITWVVIVVAARFG